MSTFGEIRRKVQLLATAMAEQTGVPLKIVINVIYYAKNLTTTERPDMIDEHVFIAQMGLRFGITSRFHLQLMFEGIRLKNTNHVRLEDYVRTVCIFFSPDLDVQIDWVFRVYDFKQDGFLEISEMTQLLRTSLVSVGGEENDPADALADLINLVLRVTDTNHDGQISLEEFRAFVKHDILCIQLFGTVLPASDVINGFMTIMKNRTPLRINELFKDERSLCLNEPVIPSAGTSKYFPGVLLDIS